MLQQDLEERCFIQDLNWNMPNSQQAADEISNVQVSLSVRYHRKRQRWSLPSLLYTKLSQHCVLIDSKQGVGTAR